MCLNFKDENSRKSDFSKCYETENKSKKYHFHSKNNFFNYTIYALYLEQLRVTKYVNRFVLVPCTVWDFVLAGGCI